MSTDVAFVVTGFGKFKSVDKNPTTDLIEDLLIDELSRSRILASRVFVVSTEAVNAEFPDLLSKGADELNKTVVFLSFGVAAGSKTVDIELVGANEASFRVPDEAGFQPAQQLIEESGPDSVETALPGALLVDMMWSRGHTCVRQSNNAGRFLCNYLAYKSYRASQAFSAEYRSNMAAAAWPRYMSLFVHVPSQTDLERGSLLAVARDLMCCIAEVVASRTQGEAHDAGQRIQAEKGEQLWTERATTAAKSADFRPTFDVEALRSALTALSFPEQDISGVLTELARPNAVAPTEGTEEIVSRAVAMILQAQENHATAAAPQPSSMSAHVQARVKLALVVRTDLGMAIGKTAAQASHAALKAARVSNAEEEKPRRSLIQAWRSHGEPIVVLKCDSLAHLEALHSTAEELGVHTATVKDAGRTQVAPGTVTVLAVGPAAEEVVDVITGSLKLL